MSLGSLVPAVQRRLPSFSISVSSGPQQSRHASASFRFGRQRLSALLTAEPSLNLFSSCRMSLLWQSLLPFPSSAIRHITSTTSFPQHKCLRDISQMSCIQLTTAASNALKEGYFDRLLWKRYSYRALELTAEFTTPQIASLLKSFSVCKFQDFNLFTHLSARVLEELDGEKNPGAKESCAADTAATLIVAYGGLQFSDTRVLSLLLDVVVAKVERLRPKDLANMAHAYAKLRIPDEELFHLVAHAIPPYLGDISPMAIANLCSAFARCHMYDKRLFDSIGRNIMERPTQFGATELLNILNAFGRIHCKLPKELCRDDHNLTRVIMNNLRRVMAPLGLSQRISIMQSLIALKYDDPQLIHGKLIPSIADRLVASNTEHAPEHFCRILEALAALPALSHTAARLLEDVLVKLRGVLEFDLQLLFRTARALLKLDYANADLLEKMQGVLLKNARRFKREVSADELQVLLEMFQRGSSDSLPLATAPWFADDRRLRSFASSAPIASDTQSEHVTIEQTDSTNTFPVVPPLNSSPFSEAVAFLSELISQKLRTDPLSSARVSSGSPQACAHLFGTPATENCESVSSKSLLSPQNRDAAAKRVLRVNVAPSTEGADTKRIRCGDDAEEGGSAAAMQETHTSQAHHADIGGRTSDVLPVVLVHTYSSVEGFETSHVVLNKHRTAKK